MLNKTVLVRSLALAFGAVIVFPALPALAQDAAPATPDQQPMQRVTVTGSLISRADKETPSPVQVLTADDIAKTGYTSVAEVLTNLASNGQGTLGSGFSAAFANGGAGVSLRGLTVGLTLVLIDGHRMAPYPLSDDGQRQFVDVSAIPFDAVERIEVLKDGASALYGSDAVAGVVNVILKKSFNGLSLKADAGKSQHGGGKTYKASLTTGIGNLEADGYNAFVSAEYRHADPIRLSQRAGHDWASGDWRGRGGIDTTRGVPTIFNNFLAHGSTPFFYNPAGAGGVNNPANFQFLDAGCNYAKYRAGGCAVPDTWSFIQPESRNVNLLGGFAKKLGEDWTLALKASMFRRESENNRGWPLTFSPASFPGFTSLVPGEVPRIVNVIPSTLFAPGVLGNQLGAPARLYGQLPGFGAASTNVNTSTSTRFVADLQGSAYGWGINAAAGYTRVKTESEYSGYADRIALYELLNNGTFNPLGGNAPDVMARVQPRFGNDSTSVLKFVEVNAQREIAQLPGGPLNLAVGVNWKKKELDAPSADLLARGVVGNGGAYVFGDETNSAVFAELEGNVVKNVLVNLAARYDHYDTYGNSFTPSAKFKWTIAPTVSLRGTFARGFRAPNAAEVGTASSIFSSYTADDPILCADGNPRTAGNVPTACNLTPAFVQVTTPNLEPEKSKSFTLGLVVEPVRNISATLDYYTIDVKNQVTSAATLPGFVPTFVRNAIAPVEISNGDGTTHTGLPSVGTIAYATTDYVNAGGTKTSGMELNLSARRRLGEWGNVRGELTFNHMISYELESAGVTYQLAGTHGPSTVSGNTGNPKNRAQLTLGWERGPAAITATVNWVDKFSALDPSVDSNDCASAANISGRNYFFGGDTPAYYCTVHSFTTTDLNATWKLNRNWTLRASILNLFDREPPIDVGTYSNANTMASYNGSLHQSGAVGRYFSIGASYAF